MDIKDYNVEIFQEKVTCAHEEPHQDNLLLNEARSYLRCKDSCTSEAVDCNYFFWAKVEKKQSCLLFRACTEIHENKLSSQELRIGNTYEKSN